MEPMTERLPMKVSDLHIETMDADQLRALSSTVIDQLLNGSLTPAQANAITRRVNQRLAVVQAVLKVDKIRNRDF
jgi:hypothetical protein